MLGALWGLFVVLVVLWLLGFVVFHVTSVLIHILLMLAVIVLVYNLVMRPAHAAYSSRFNESNTASNGVTNLELPHCWLLLYWHYFPLNTQQVTSIQVERKVL